MEQARREGWGQAQGRRFPEREGPDSVPWLTAPVPIEPQICQATCAVMKLSFDEEYRRAMNELGECPLASPHTLQPPIWPQGCWALLSPGQAFSHSGLGAQRTGKWPGSQKQR